MATVTVTPTIINEVPQTIETPKAQNNNIFDTALLLVITRRWIPQTKTVKSKVLQSTADARMISVTKKLFDSHELKAIWRHEEKLDEYIKWTGTPFPLKKGHHLIAADLFHQVETRLVAHAEQRSQLIDNFIAAYAKSVNDAKLLLGDQFNPNDYPSEDRVRNMFQFRWEYLQFTVSDKLRELNKEVADRKEEEWRSTIVQAGEAADQLLTAQFKLLIDHLADKLKPTGELNEDGSEKKKKLHDNMLDKINEFLSNLPARNLNSNAQLKAFATQAESLIKGVTPAQIKANDGLKKQVSDGFASLKDTLDKFVVEAGGRSITFED